MNFTNKTEQELFDDMNKGNISDVLQYIPARYFEEELTEILFFWSQYRNDPQQLVSKLNNHVAKMICEAANNIEEFEVQQSEEDRRREMLDWHQECLRDRRAQEGF